MLHLSAGVHLTPSNAWLFFTLIYFEPPLLRTPVVEEELLRKEEMTRVIIRPVV